MGYVMTTTGERHPPLALVIDGTSLVYILEIYLSKRYVPSKIYHVCFHYPLSMEVKIVPLYDFKWWILFLIVLFETISLENGHVYVFLESQEYMWSSVSYYLINDNLLNDFNIIYWILFLDDFNSLIWQHHVE